MAKNPFAFKANAYSISDDYLKVRYAIFLFIFSLIAGTIGFELLEGYSFIEGFYMAVITISTVGYEEVKPLTSSGQIFASFYIIINIGIFAYTISAFSKYIIHGEAFKSIHYKMINKKVQELSNHVIICGYGRYGKQIATRFERHKVDYVVIDRDPDTIEEIQSSPDKILYIQGDAAQDEILVAAGINRCKALIAVMDDDASNLFTVLSSRQLNPWITIISRAKEETSEKKLVLAGANHTIMPEHIGGFYISNLVNKPNTVEFFNQITEQVDSNIGFEELEFDKLPDNCKGKSIRDLKIREKTGTNIIGYKNANGDYIVNPSPDTKFEAGTSFIALGNKSQLAKLLDYIKNY